MSPLAGLKARSIFFPPHSPEKPHAHHKRAAVGILFGAPNHTVCGARFTGMKTSRSGHRQLAAAIAVFLMSLAASAGELREAETERCRSDQGRSGLGNDADQRQGRMLCLARGRNSLRAVCSSLAAHRQSGGGRHCEEAEAECFHTGGSAVWRRFSRPRLAGISGRMLRNLSAPDDPSRFLGRERGAMFVPRCLVRNASPAQFFDPARYGLFIDEVELGREAQAARRCYQPL